MSDAFAYLSNDIILDVLQIGSRTFEDLQQLEETESNWADVIRCGGFRKERVEDDELTSSCYDYGLVECKRSLKSYNKNENWDLPIFRDVSVSLTRKPSELRKRILQHSTGRVDLCINYEVAVKGEVSEAFDILSSRAITELKYNHCIGIDSRPVCFPKILRIQSLRSFRCDHPLSEFESGTYQLFINFIKKPNFVFLSILDQSLLLAKMVLKNWMRKTSLPKHMQCVQLKIYREEILEDNEFLAYLSEQGLKLVHEFRFHYSYYYDSSHIYYLDHPQDSSKRIEILVNPRVVELCLTSKEDSVWDEFSEYSKFLLRRYIHENGPIVPPNSVKARQRMD